MFHFIPSPPPPTWGARLPREVIPMSFPSLLGDARLLREATFLFLKQ